ncbi:MAG: hypothetical protein JWN08_2912 [Frankiales bacterium]|jgi:uncharacterized integral membrane protein|nr:hypothetical protein [Frankiales bacterium]
MALVAQAWVAGTLAALLLLVLVAATQRMVQLVGTAVARVRRLAGSTATSLNDAQAA